MKDFNEKVSLCAANRIFGFEPKIARTLITSLGSASGIFEIGQKEIDSLLGPYSKYKGLICPRAYEAAAEELEALSSQGVSFIGCTEDGYPPLLNECQDPPCGLYIKSSSDVHELFCTRRAVSVIGTRDLSPYGKEWCRRIVEGLSMTGERPTIVSGLAIGTDICAHSAALEERLPTIAVLPTGPDSIYPYRHRAIAEQIAGTRGCALVTDYPPGTAPLAIHFLRRNRIIAGMSESTILIESRNKGGGMMTSRLAASYDRNVFALPGRIDDIRSQGCNTLIKENIAEAITSVDSLIEGMRMKQNIKRTADYSEIFSAYKEKLGKEAADEAYKIYTAIRQNRGICLDELASFLNLEYATISRLTAMMETDGLISIDLMRRCTLKMFRL